VCGRFVSTSSPRDIAERFGVDEVALAHDAPDYNVAPRSKIMVVRARREQRVLSRVRWGLIPSWAKDPGIGDRMINARAETLAEKPAYRRAFAKRRCLIPADGFYEWKVTAAGGKQPIHIGMKDRSLFAFAGLTERWLSPAGEVLDTCTIITTHANALLATMHDRMPVIVAPAQYGRWLDVAVADVGDLFAPFPADAMTYYPVSTRVNSVRHDDATLIEPVPEAGNDAQHAAPAPAHAPTHEPPPEQTELF
jgi:putative SOS response-associated peptidase YedK